MESTPTPDVTNPSGDAPIIFRAKKKKATIRARPDHSASSLDTPSLPANDESHVGAPITRETGEAEAEDDEGLSVAELLRRRRKQQRIKGVSRPHGELEEEEIQEQALVRAENALDNADTILGGIPKRFAAQTGLVGELVNKHMMEYVESKLTRRQATLGEGSAQQQQQQGESPHTSLSDDHSFRAPPGAFDPQKRTMHGKLMEVDLGEESRNHNVALTEQAKRKLHGQPGDDGDSDGRFSRKTRLGKDGQPIRNRNRRNSDDLKRDQLVEQILHESKLDVYRVPEENPSTDANREYEGSADDRIAEEFKREFLDAIAQRRQKRRAARPTRPAEKKADPDVLRGPKLGGSRNVRSAVRDILLQQEKEKAKALRR